MGYIPTPEQAMELVKKYNREPFHIQHAQTVGKVLAYIARENDPGNEDYWNAVGILHDIDFERWPEQHCVKAQELLREEDVDETVIHAVASHGYGLCCDVEPERLMEKYLFAVDEFTGLIGAAALMRPTGLDGMEVKSVMKKFKDKKFAAGCSRDVIARGAEMLGLTVPELAGKVLAAMQAQG
ncbi:MAG: HDIG domain-containing metalloprotein [Clostridia bacterium]